MQFLVNNKNKIIFGWSPKCGCSHIKRIFYFIEHNNSNLIDNIHGNLNASTVLPYDIENYTTIIISRNPYKRLVSGFLDKYNINGEFRKMWKWKFITFSMFVNELEKQNWNAIEKHHFEPQTSGGFDKKILNSKCIKFYDVENIDYKYIEELCNVKIPENVLHKKEGHERKKYNKDFNERVDNLYMMKYYYYNVNIKYFYSEKLKDTVRKFYNSDFEFFYLHGIDYINLLFL